MDKATRFAEAFYGGDIPVSQQAPLSQSVMQLVMTLTSDLKVKVQDIEPETLERAIIAGLSTLRELGAKHPNIHRTEHSMYTKSFQSALAKIRMLKSAKESITEKRVEERETTERLAERSNAAAAIYDHYSSLKMKYTQDEFDNPAVEAYKELLTIQGLDLSGYAYYVIVWKIPQENNIYFHEGVIEAQNNHPRISDRSVDATPRMEVNGEKWSQIG